MQVLTSLATCVFLLYATPASPQTRASTADIAGRVLDQTGAALVGVAVTATHTPTNVVRTAVTDIEGHFILPGLPVGPYDVRAALQGFEPGVVEGVVAQIGDRTSVGLTLVVASVSETVTVAGAPVVDTSKTSVSSVIGTAQIAGLPINGRDFLAFAQLTPGVLPDRGAASQETSGLSFAGQRGRTNNISVDGLDNNGVNLGTVRSTISQDAAAEFQVMTSGFAAEFGKATGGLVNIATRSGTNARAGSTFLFARDDALNGREFAGAGGDTTRGKAPFDQQQFGGTIGGPILRDRVFFFGSFERQQTRGSRFVNIDDQDAVSHPVLPVIFGTTADVLREAGLPVSTGFQPYDQKRNLYLTKVDYHRGRDWFAARVHGATRTDDLVEPFGGLTDRSRALRLESSDVQVAGWWTSAPSNRWLQDLRFQFAREVDRERGLDPACAGICDALDEGGPAVDVLGVASVGRNTGTPSSSDFRYLQVLETVSRYGERHDLRAGIDFGYRRIADNYFPLNFGGLFIFADLPEPIANLIGLPGPISAIQAVALGLPAVYVRGYGQPDAGESSNADLSLFVQDEWRAGAGLTIKAGLRYQVQHFSTRAFAVSGIDGEYTFPSDLNNVAPRIAVAWDQSGDARLVVRGSYGVSFERTLAGLEGSATVLNPASGIRTLVATGPTAFVAWSLPGHQLPEALAGPYAPTTIAVDPSLRTPYAHQTTVGFDRRVGAEGLLSVDATFVEGRAGVGVLDYNPLVPALGPGRRPGDVDGVPGSSGPVLQYTSFAESSYRGLLVSYAQRVAGRGRWLVSYTLSKTEDDSADFTVGAASSGQGRNPADPQGLPLGFDPASERGPSLQDQRHRFVASGLMALRGSISIATIATLGSGRPFNVTAGQDLNGDGTPDSDRPLAVAGELASSIDRNAGRLPAEASLDVRVSWTHRLGRGSVEWIAEAFNLFNRRNVVAVNGVFGPGPYPDMPAPGFGATTLAAPPRQVQLALRVRF